MRELSLFIVIGVVIIFGISLYKAIIIYKIAEYIKYIKNISIEEAVQEATYYYENKKD